MSEKRRDKKGRILRNGEHQRGDGRYQYSYIGLDGKQKCVYSWKLEPTDAFPKGKRNCKSLREKEKEIQKDIDNGIIPDGGKLTVIDLVEKYINQKNGVRPTTKHGYNTVINTLKKNQFGMKRIDKISLSDAKMWIIKLQRTYGKSYGSIRLLVSTLKPAFQMAVDDNYIRKNPFSFQISTVITNDSSAREAITYSQKSKFLEFIKNDKCYCKYYDAIYILFHTGLRISEFAGLTLNDINLQEKTINVDHQLQCTSHMEYVILPPKSKSGIRTIPITDDVCKCFENIIANRKIPKKEPMIDGYTDFLILNWSGMPRVSKNWDYCFKRIVKKYNKIHEEQMPRITPHVCRHTYCSHLASSGINPKTLQYLMGHSNISITLDIYAHIDFNSVCKELNDLEHKLKHNVLT